jgi:putative FmdB family regulatory protein
LDETIIEEIRMPIFEFICTECGAPFEDLVRSARAIDEVICPSCGSDQVKKQISTFASRVNGGASSNLYSRVSTPSCSTGSV